MNKSEYKYELNLELIDNPIGVYGAILGCMYDYLCDIKTELDTKQLADARYAFDDLMRSFQMYVKLNKKPHETIIDRYDCLETLENCRQVCKYPERIKKIDKLIKNNIIIEVYGYGSEEHLKELMKYVPSFKNVIIVDL